MFSGLSGMVSDFAELRLAFEIVESFAEVFGSMEKATGVRSSWTGWHERQPSHTLRVVRPFLRRPDASKIMNVARRRPTVFYRSVRS